MNTLQTLVIRTPKTIKTYEIPKSFRTVFMSAHEETLDNHISYFSWYKPGELTVALHKEPESIAIDKDGDVWIGEFMSVDTILTPVWEVML